MKRKLLLSLVILLGFVTNSHSQTGCSTIFSVPFHEGFNSGSPSESCWTVANINNDSDAWDMGYTTNPYEGNQCAALNTDLNAGNNSDWLITPKIQLTGNEALKFRYRVESALEPNDFKVMISVNGTDPNDFTPLVGLASYNNTDYVEMTVYLSGYSGVVNIAWVVPAGGLDGSRLYIDDISVVPPPTCWAPTMLQASTTSTTINLSWLNSGQETAWQVLALPCGAPAPLDSTTGYIETTSNPLILTGLNPATCYDIYVRSVCSIFDISSWSDRLTTTTVPNSPVCGGTFTDAGGPTGDYPGNSNATTTICPENPGDAVTVTFTSFNTEANFDALYVYDGNSIAAPQITSSNPAGNSPNVTPGGYWGSQIPGPFTASGPDGCLTFKFVSDNSVNNPGWIANVTCSPVPSCTKPYNVAVNNVTLTSATLAWIDNNAITNWQILALPCGSASPSINDAGQLVTTNPVTITNLDPGTCYDFYVSAICSATDKSYWSYKTSATTLYPAPANDECTNAIMVPVNNNGCNQVTAGTISGATASAGIPSTCLGTPDDDVWYSFVATYPILAVSLQNVTGSTSNLNFGVYSGACNALTQLGCSSADLLSVTLNNLTIGQTYYLRVYSNAATTQTANFSVCVTIPSTCSAGESICGVNNYQNSINIPSLGTIGCLYTTPNPTFFTLRIASSGAVNLNIRQSTVGSAIPNLDVDYAAWGPFTSQTEACNYIGSSQPFSTPGIGVPLSLTTGCSYSTSPTENLNIANAEEGQFYIVLVTNFSNQPGIINIIQTNNGDLGAGSIDCSGIRLNAFIDTNGNGTQDNGEGNFPLGQFHYTINNNSQVHNITTPSGTYIVYDNSLTNSYDLTYSIDSDYSTMYATSASYSNITVSSGGLMATYNFPITVLQNYNDAGITIVPLSAPRAGAAYENKIVYFNNGNQTIAAGTVTFNNAAATAITNISQTGTTATANGFTYNFTNLLPFESRSIIVTMSVPAIPNVSIGQLLTNTASITPPAADTVSGNDSSSTTEGIIAAYDPNDKTESHGGKILISSFTSNDYLEYTIRFENTGNSSALDVAVNDILDSKLDENSLIMIDASHQYTLDRVFNSLTWNFRNIQLPVAIAGTETGKGYIKFKVKPKAGYAVGDIIPNTASIYFDSNPAIVTNTFNTEFVQTLENPNFNAGIIALYPNPARDRITVSSHNAIEKITAVTIYDVSGKKIFAMKNAISDDITIDVAHFAKGLYLVELVSDKNSKITKKLIIK